MAQYQQRKVSTKRSAEDGTVEAFECTVEVPQAESVEEAVSWSGGEEDFLKFVNGAIATGAVNGARQFARNASVDKLSAVEVAAKCQTIARGYRPSGSERGPSKKEQIAEFQGLMARINSDNPPSEDELRALAQKYA